MILIKIKYVIIYSGEYIILAQKNKMIKILTDASDKIGYGHLQRCLELKKNYFNKFELYICNKKLKIKI